MPIIQVDHVTKEYKLGQLTSLKQTVMNSFNRIAGRPVEERKPFKALEDINFSVEQGEVLGIIGHNGAGKSTLLKLLANISTPSSGSLLVKGKIAPLIEVGAGLIPDLTGRENIYLNGAILGIPKKEIDRKFDDIVAFAELEEFIDTPIKRYSSGMQVRLGFSIATSVESDILIVDEVLAVGDIAFQRKCIDRMENVIKNEGKTVLIVGHNIRQLERMCSRMMLLRQGRIELDGAPGAVSKLFFDESTAISEKQLQESRKAMAGGSAAEVEVRDITSLSGNKINDRIVVQLFSDLKFRITLYCHHVIPKAEINIGLHNTEMIFITKASTLMLPDPVDLAEGLNVIEVTMPRISLTPGPYGLGLGIYDWTRRTLGGGTNLLTLSVDVESQYLPKLPVSTLTYLPASWNFQKTALEL